MILTLLATILGTGLFFLMNATVDISYFGCGAVFSAWLSCIVIAYILIMLLGGIALTLIKWIVIIGILVLVVGLLFT